MVGCAKAHPLVLDDPEPQAYFLDFVPQLRAAVDIPVMVTGGFRTVGSMVQAVEHEGVDVIGSVHKACLHQAQVGGDVQAVC